MRKVVGISVILTFVVIAVILLLAKYVPSSIGTATGTPSNPATEQLVVWSLMEENAPAHYVNYGVADGGYETACRKHMSGMGGATQFANIERMETEGHKPCADCIRALRRFTADLPGTVGEHSLDMKPK